MSQKPIISAVEALKRFKGQFFRTIEGGRFLIVQETISPEGDLTLQRMKKRDFVERYADQVVEEPDPLTGKPRLWPIGLWWAEHQEARTVDRIIFDPDPKRQVRPNTYNTYQGPSVKAAEGPWPLIEDYLRTVLANGDEPTYEFMLKWLAALVQRPHQPGYYCLAFKGSQGTGKTTFGHLCRQLCGPAHYVALSNQKHLTGHFNEILEHRIVVLADEAFWSGDKQGLSSLKALITDATILIEPKNLPVRVSRNCLHVILAANHDWVAPVERGNRRFVVTEVSDAHRNDKAYFGALHAAIHGDELRGFLYMLQHMEIPDRIPLPTSAALTFHANEQMRAGFNPFLRWLDGRLEDGIAVRKTSELGWPDTLLKTDLFDDFREELRDGNVSTFDRMNSVWFFRKLRQIFPTLQEKQHRAEDRQRRVLLPDLERARTDMEAYCGTTGLYERLDPDA